MHSEMPSNHSLIHLRRTGVHQKVSFTSKHRCERPRKTSSCNCNNRQFKEFTGKNNTNIYIFLKIATQILKKAAEKSCIFGHDNHKKTCENPEQNAMISMCVISNESRDREIHFKKHTYTHTFICTVGIQQKTGKSRIPLMVTFIEK